MDSVAPIAGGRRKGALRNRSGSLRWLTAPREQQLREKVLLPLSTESVEMTRLIKSVRRALGVYARLLSSMVSSLAKALSKEPVDDSDVRTKRDALERTTNFVVERHGELLESLRWRQRTLLETLVGGWAAWADFEHSMQQGSADCTKRLQQVLGGIYLPKGSPPKADWKKDLKA